MRSPTGTRLFAWVVAYLAAAGFVLLLQPQPGPSTWYMPVALGIGLLLRMGRRWWPVILVMEVVISGAQYRDGLVSAVAIAIPTTLESVIGAGLVKRFDVDLRAVEHALVVGFIALGTAFIGATSGALLGVPLGPGAVSFVQWATWFSGDAAAIASLLPLVILVVRRHEGSLVVPASRLRILEIGVIALSAVLLVALASWTAAIDPSHGGRGFRFLWVLPALWAAVRYERAVTAVIVAVTATTSAIATSLLAQVIDDVDRIAIAFTLVGVSLLAFSVAAALASRRRVIEHLEAALDDLDASEERYATLFTASPSVQFLVDPVTMAFVDANEAAASFYGWSRDELRTMRIPDVSTSSLARIVATLEYQGKLFSMVAEHRLASGETRRMEVTTAPVRVGGRLLHHAVLRDVSAEVAARAEVARLAAVVESAGEAVVTTDLEGRISGWNAAASALYGHERTAVLGRPVEEVLGPIEIGTEEIARIVRSGGSVRFAQVVRRALDGEAIPVGLTLSPILDGETLVGVSRISHDLRHTIADRERLERSEALLADAARIGRIGSWERDPLTGEIRISEELYRIMGLAIGSPVTAAALAEAIDPDDRERVRAALGAQDEAEAHAGYRLHAGDGVVRDVMASRRRLTGPDGVLREVGVMRDVTEERALEEQLRQAQRMESIGLLAGGVAHDFNNLLTVVSGFTHLARAAIADGSDPDPDLAQVEAAAERARALTAQLLAFGRRAVVHPRPVDLAEAVRALVPMLTRLLGEQIRVVTALDPGVVAIIDPGQFDQVIVNLAVNARDAMSAGGRLRIAVGLADEASSDGSPGRGEVAWVEVEDEGTGIPHDVLDHIFLPFYTTKERGHGTGLGLSTAQGIVAQAGGRIRVTSVPGQGATFRIEMPAVKPVPQAEPAPHVVEHLTSLGVVLLVEDEELVRRVGERVLVRAGFRVLLAANVAEALAAADAERPDILVTDVVLPGRGDGIGLAGDLHTRWPDLPVIIMTGYSEQPPPPWASLVLKPYQPNELVATVQRLLDEAGPTILA